MCSCFPEQPFVTELDECHVLVEFPEMSSYGFTTPIGTCAVSWQNEEITGFQLPPVEVVSDEAPAWITQVMERVQRHLRGDLQDFSDLPFAWNAVSEFQQKIYMAALRVKAGEVQSYGRLCAVAGFPASSARAAGTALGQNPWPLLVPCHRFVGANGKMVGFSAPGGIQTKLRLLVLEGSEMFPE